MLDADQNIHNVLLSGSAQESSCLTWVRCVVSDRPFILVLPIYTFTIPSPPPRIKRFNRLQ
uniref:Uncharacterized protein n=1 Tax=Faecalibaculum rodentium TaxID=1702221 RepID=A0A140DYG6_9FIRM|nr:hypothetical protein AALO17_25590 [Faecalibaculum rodentium]